MQRAKMYNIQVKAYFIFGHFVLKKYQILNLNFRVLKKLIFFFETQKLLVDSLAIFKTKSATIR